MNRSQKERWSGLSIFPAVLTVTYPLWSPSAYDSLWPTLIPQISAYACLALWCAANDRRLDRLFLVSHHLKKSLLLGGLVGILTGLINLWVIVKLTPWLGYSYDFLRDTPHARMPLAFMVPWGIVLIAVFVEINFRGFMMGRFMAMTENRPYGIAVAVILSAIVFSRDPFMVAVFRGYHWLALTDGLIWGGLLFWARNLSSTVTAHSVEVILVYSILRIFYA